MQDCDLNSTAVGPAQPVNVSSGANLSGDTAPEIWREEALSEVAQA